MPCPENGNGGSADCDKKNDCLLRRGLEESHFPVPKEFCNPTVTIDIAVVDQGVPNVDATAV